MRFRLVLALIGSALLGSAFIGCSGAASSSSQPAAAALPAVPGAPASQARKVGGTRRTESTPGCSSPGTSAFAGGGVSNIAGGTYSTVVAGSGNESCGLSTGIVGGTSNTIASTNAGNPVTNGFIGGGESNLISAFTDGFIGAGSTNSVTSPRGAIVSGSVNSVAATDAIIASGEGDTISVSGTMAFIGDGNGNTVSAEYGTVVNGVNNSVSAQYGVIGSGINNTVSGQGGYVASGGYNNVSGTGAVIVGGFNSAAAGNFATIPGGYTNSAAGIYSFAAGARASAANTGAFVWSDGSDGATFLTSSQNYQFLARASGGFTLWTNAASTVGATLAPGSGTWASASDRNLKTDVAGIDDDAVLDKVASLPISRWSYKSERGVSHVGPMAQDFYAAFKLGQDDKHITSIDEDGVALAAIKALHAENAQLRARLTTVEASHTAQITDLKRELARLSTTVATLHRN